MKEPKTAKEIQQEIIEQVNKIKDAVPEQYKSAVEAVWASGVKYQQLEPNLAAQALQKIIEESDRISEKDFTKHSPAFNLGLLSGCISKYGKASLLNKTV